MDFFSIAGLAVSGIGLLNDFGTTYRDILKWQEEDVEVDAEWLELALNKGIIEGTLDSFAWANLRRVPTLELKGTHQPVVAINKDKRVKYRIVRGSVDDRLVLMKKVS